MLFLTNCECLGMQLQLSEHFTYPNTLRSQRVRITEVLLYIHIREYDSTLYVGLARAVSPTNTNFRLTFLLTRLQEALYEDLAV